MPYRKPGEVSAAGPQCPRCERKLVATEIGPNTVERCEECGGAWLAAREFNDLLLDLDRQDAVRQQEPIVPAAPDDSTSLDCPHCGTAMRRANFWRHSGVVIDSCQKHGVWLDRGELRRIVEYLATHGPSEPHAVTRPQPPRAAGAAPDELMLDDDRVWRVLAELAQALQAEVR